MLKSLRDSWVMIVGVTLPILLVIIVGITWQLPKMFVKPPTYDLLYITSQYPSSDINFEIQNEKLVAWVTPQTKPRHIPLPKLFRFDAKTQTSTEIPYNLPQIVPQDLKPNQVARREFIDIPELKEIVLDTSEKAPDGYTINFSNASPNNITGFFFSSNYYKSDLTITKDFNVVKVTGNKENSPNYNVIRFLGWIIPK